VRLLAEGPRRMHRPSLHVSLCCVSLLCHGRIALAFLQLTRSANLRKHCTVLFLCLVDAVGCRIWDFAGGRRLLLASFPSDKSPLPTGISAKMAPIVRSSCAHL
jgi:hypothetical protein